MKYTRSKKRIIIGFSFLVFFVVFTVLASFRVSEAAKEKRRYEQEKSELVAPEPTVVEVGLKSLPRTRRYAAELRPWALAQVPAEVSGRVVEVLFEAGDEVAEGQALARLDDTLAKIAVARAQTRLDEALRLQGEARRLLDSRAISATAYEAQAAAVKVEQAALEEAAELLRRHAVRAPFAGVIQERMVDKGDAVSANQPVAKLVDLGKLRVEFFVSETDLPHFPRGKELDLRVESRPDLRLPVRADFVSPSADPATRLFRVEAALDNPMRLPGGLHGEIRAEVTPFENSPFVPAAAVQFAGKRGLVWKAPPEGAGGEAILQEIEVGPEIDGFYPVLEGLCAGDRVIIR